MCVPPRTERRSSKLLRSVTAPLLFICALSLAMLSARAQSPAFSPGDHDLSLVAHEDDDLLFLSPDLSQRIQAGDVVRTVYLTAGDAGLGTVYWQNREVGIQAAYAQMAGVPDGWIPSDQAVGDKLIRTYTLDAARNVSVAFLRLPDGYSATGGGYAVTGYQSLQRLWEGEISTISSLDGTNTYTREELVQTLVALIMDWGSVHIATQDSSDLYGWDHPDHRYGARFAFEAHQRYAASGAPHTFTLYRDYNISNEPVNLTQAQRDYKWAVFSTYALHDTEMCGGTGTACLIGGSYDSWSYRQYSVAQAKDLAGTLGVASGECLTSGADLAAGIGAVFITACAGASSQSWTLHADGAVTAGDGRCLEVRGGVSQDATYVQLAGCTGAPLQRWTAFANGQIRGLNGKCLAVPGNPPTDGTFAQINSCALVPGQQWTLPPASAQVPASPDFSLALASDSSFTATLPAGDSAAFRLVLTPRAFLGPVVLSCSGLPPGAACSFSPDPVTLDGQNPASVSLHVTTTARARHVPRPILPFSAPTRFPDPTALLGVLLLLGITVLLSRPRRAWVGGGMLLLAVSLCASCGNAVTGPGGNGISPETPSGNYAFTIVATSGSLTRSLSLTLKVQ